MTRPFAYELPVMRLVASLKTQINGQPVILRGVYVYWFVDGTKYTAEHWQRMWWMARDMLATGYWTALRTLVIFPSVCPGRRRPPMSG